MKLFHLLVVLTSCNFDVVETPAILSFDCFDVVETPTKNEGFVFEEVQPMDKCRSTTGGPRFTLI